MLILFLCIAVCIFVPAFRHVRPGHELTYLADILLGMALGGLGTRAVIGWRYIKLWGKLFRVWIRGQRLRISFAALVRMSSGSHYLLVKSSRTQKWQPVGGVYRIYDNRVAASIGLRDDSAMPTQEPPELRKEFAPENVFKAFSLLAWFESRKGRETSPHREFHEELVLEGILPELHFAQPEFEYVHFHRSITYSVPHRCWELKYFEVFEFKPNSEQGNVLAKLFQDRDQAPSYLFLTQSEIESGGYRSGNSQVLLGDQTKHLFLQ